MILVAFVYQASVVATRKMTNIDLNEPQDAPTAKKRRDSDVEREQYRRGGMAAVPPQSSSSSVSRNHAHGSARDVAREPPARANRRSRSLERRRRSPASPDRRPRRRRSSSSPPRRRRRSPSYDRYRRRRSPSPSYNRRSRRSPSPRREASDARRLSWQATIRADFSVVIGIDDPTIATQTIDARHRRVDRDAQRRAHRTRRRLALRRRRRARARRHPVALHVHDKNHNLTAFNIFAIAHTILASRCLLRSIHSKKCFVFLFYCVE